MAQNDPDPDSDPDPATENLTQPVASAGDQLQQPQPQPQSHGLWDDHLSSSSTPPLETGSGETRVAGTRTIGNQISGTQTSGNQDGDTRADENQVAGTRAVGVQVDGTEASGNQVAATRPDGLDVDIDIEEYGEPVGGSSSQVRTDLEVALEGIVRARRLAKSASAFVDTLPNITYNPKFSYSECTICQVGFLEKQMLKKLPCKHYYHEPCLSRWLATNSTCPLCRYQLQWQGMPILNDSLGTLQETQP